jgi:hypothetical protein
MVLSSRDSEGACVLRELCHGKNRGYGKSEDKGVWKNKKVHGAGP